jgi:hypothetical protein
VKDAIEGAGGPVLGAAVALDHTSRASVEADRQRARTTDRQDAAAQGADPLRLRGAGGVRGLDISPIPAAASVSGNARLPQVTPLQCCEVRAARSTHGTRDPAGAVLLRRVRVEPQKHHLGRLSSYRTRT